MTRSQYIEEIKERAQRLQASPRLQISAGHVAQDYATLLEYIEKLEEELEEKDQYIIDLEDEIQEKE